MFEIHAPVQGYTGWGYGLHFVGGKACTENAYIAHMLHEKGYTVVISSDDTSEMASDDLSDRVTEFNAKEDDPELVSLRAEADALGIKYHGNAKADTIRARIALHREDQDELK